MGKSIFVTVGSTSFDDLSLAVLDPDLLRCLADLSYTHLTLQHGRLSILLPDASSFASDLTVAKFDYSADILKEIEHADLVISHAGAGTVLEVLKWHKRLIVVANETLMDNHQLELAKKLVKEGYCLSSVPEPKSLIQAIVRSENFDPVDLPSGNGSRLDGVISEELSKLD